MFSYPTLALLLAATARATQLDVLTFSSSQTYLDLGGTSTSQNSGTIYRIDGGPWKEIANDEDKSPCAYGCDKYSPNYVVPELGGNTFGICTVEASCVPGQDFGCKFKYGDIVVSYESSTDSSVWGLATQIATYCGGAFVTVG
jgi:hypothetical protein